MTTSFLDCWLHYPALAAALVPGSGGAVRGTATASTSAALRRLCGLRLPGAGATSDVLLRDYCPRTCEHRKPGCDGAEPGGKQSKGGQGGGRLQGAKNASRVGCPDGPECRAVLSQGLLALAAAGCHGAKPGTPWGQRGSQGMNPPKAWSNASGPEREQLRRLCAQPLAFRPRRQPSAQRPAKANPSSRPGSGPTGLTAKPTTTKPTTKPTMTLAQYCPQACSPLTGGPRGACSPWPPPPAAAAPTPAPTPAPRDDIFCADTRLEALPCASLERAARQHAAAFPGYCEPMGLSLPALLAVYCAPANLAQHGGEAHICSRDARTLAAGDGIGSQ